MRRLVVIGVLALVGAAACGDDDAPPVSERVDAEVYEAVVRWFDGREPPLEGDELRPAFLDGLDDQVIPIEVQVGVVNALEDDLAVRFVDAEEEAIDKDVEGMPVRGGGFFLHLGPLMTNGDHVEVDVERYEGDGAVTRYRLVLGSPPSGSWRVVGEPVELPMPGDAG